MTLFDDEREERLKRQEKPERKHKGGHLQPPDRMCGLCWNKMPPAETLDACTNCRQVSRNINTLLHQIRNEFPVTRTMSTDEIFKRLWEFRLRHKELK